MGEQVVVVVDGFFEEAGEFTLSILPSENGSCEDAADNDGDGDIDTDDSDCICNNNPGIDGDLNMGAPMLGPWQVTGSTIDGNDDFRSSCGNSGQDRAYTFTAPVDGRYAFDNIGSLYEDLFYVVSAFREGVPTYDCLGSGIICRFPNPDFPRRSSLFLPAGTTLVTVIEGGGNDPETSQFTINVHLTELGACDDGIDNDQDGVTDINDDDCVCNANPGIDGNLGSALGPAVATGTTVGGGNDFKRGSCGNTSAEDRAYLWTPPADGTYIFDTLGSGYSAQLRVITPFNDSSPDRDCEGTGLICSFPGHADDPRYPLFVIGGSTVVIVIDGFDTSEVGNFVLNIEQITDEADFCENNRDDDNDTLTDCADVDDCEGQRCDTQFECTESTCSAGSCVPGNPKVCESLNPCKVNGACVEGSGCVFEDAPEGTSCDDSNTCTTNDNCQSGICQAGGFVDCEDGNPCTEDICNSGGGCDHVPLPDEDSDGLCDAIDPCLGDPTNDADDDGVCGGVDNCPTTPNSGQFDQDGDGDGDECDNCPNVSNPNQEDTDDDGTGDACEDGGCVPTSDTDVTCDGVDDDCDDATDEDYVSQPTSCGVGACAATGATSCQNGTVVDSCTPGVPTSDANCNGVDNDCDGPVDDDFVGGPTVCGVGVCVDEGVQICVNGVINSDCVPGTPQEATDVTCDGLDGDCDGATDEDFMSQPTSCGVGACAASGATACMNGTPVDTCDPGAPTPEICDGIDNDCDGVVDNVGDSDGDGSNDCVDACPNDPDNDVDGDGICGDVDNCPEDANADQTDSDNDGIGDACDEPQDNCDCCADTDITAKLFYKPLRWIVGEFCGCRKIKIPLPAELPVVEGNAGNQWASLAFRQNRRAVACFYKGGANSSHPTSPSQIAKGLKYNFAYCTNGMRPGQMMNTDKMVLVVLSGDSQSPSRHNPRTVVTMPIVENSSTGCDVCSQPGGEGSCHGH
jgi:hypothetical protein